MPPAVPQQPVPTHVKVGGDVEGLGGVGVVQVWGNQTDTILDREEYDITYDISKYISTYIMTYTFRVFPRN